MRSLLTVVNLLLLVGIVNNLLKIKHSIKLLKQTNNQKETLIKKFENRLEKYLLKEGGK